MKYHLGTKEFQTKQEVKKEVQALLEQKNVGPLQGEESMFILDLLKWHPEYEKKKGVGIQEVGIRLNVGFGKKEFYLKRIDDTEDNASYLKCINGRPTSTFHNRLQAYRNAVEGQIQNFRETTLRPDDGKSYHVDHELPFILLVRLFEYGITTSAPTTFDDHPTKNNAIFKDSDLEFQQEWQNFHMAHAKLQWLTIEQHSEKTTEDKNVILTSSEAKKLCELLLKLKKVWEVLEFHQEETILSALIDLVATIFKVTGEE